MSDFGAYASLESHIIHGHRLVGKVNVVVDKRRVDRSRVRLAEVEIGDETGTVSLRARDEQIDVLRTSEFLLSFVWRNKECGFKAEATNGL